MGTGVSGTTGRQGYSVALSSDGNLLAVGAPEDGSAVGAVWIFARTVGGTTWSQTAKLVATTTANEQQGTSVALSSDGTTLAVGAVGDGSGVGAAWVWLFSGGSWAVQQRVIGTGNNGNSARGRASRFPRTATRSRSADRTTIPMSGIVGLHTHLGIVDAARVRSLLVPTIREFRIRATPSR